MPRRLVLPEELEFGLTDRSRKALEVSGVSMNEMAATLRVSRNTVTISSWTYGDTLGSAGGLG